MDSVAVTVPLRPPTKKMKKRKELDALAPPHAITRRTSGKRSSQELLTDSSDDRTEYWSASTRGGRKCRGRRSRACPGLLRACSAFLACASVLATATLIWMFIDVRQQLTALRTELDQVIAGNEWVPDALQKCQSLSSDLQNNQTNIFSHLSDVKLQIANITVQLTGMQHGLHQVQDWLQTSPELVNVPKDLAALSKSVATFGSQIRDLGVTVDSLKEANTRMQALRSTMLQNITTIEHSLAELSNTTQRPQTGSSNENRTQTEELSFAIAQLSKNLLLVNETLSGRLEWAAEDQKKDHKTLVTLQDMAENVRTKVISLEGVCANVSEQDTIVSTVNKLTDQLNEARAKNGELTGQLKHLEMSYNTLRNSISELRSQQQIIKSKSVNKYVETVSSPQSDELIRESTTAANHGTAGVAEETLKKKLSTGKPKPLSI